MRSCEVLRSSHVYLVGERRDYPAKPVKFSRLPPSSFKSRLSSSRCCSESVGKAVAPTALTVESPPAGYRKSVGICLVNSSNKIFAASKIWVPDSWQMPQGGIDEGEDLRNAAIRELKEETGVTSAQFLAEVSFQVYGGGRRD
ncbi:Nudix hydrolase 27, chloroplastic [Linum grandiflorum]